MPFVLPFVPPLLLVNLFLITLLPLAPLHLDGPAPQPRLVHLPNCLYAVLGIHERYEPITPALPVMLVVAYACHGEGRVLSPEGLSELILPYVLGEISDEEAEVPLGKLRKRRVLPRLSSSNALVRLLGLLRVEGA